MLEFVIIVWDLSFYTSPSNKAIFNRAEWGVHLLFLELISFCPISSN
ncbi:hypothetical protein NB716_001098 [Pantoea ananatis]|nr:hypothetical protein [Pantoea ananatis]